MKKIIVLTLHLIFIMLTSVAFAQQPVEMADTMRSDGKIYVLVAIILVVLAGLFVYLITIDRKVSQMEKRLKK